MEKNNYKYVLTREFPFIKKRKLNTVENIKLRYNEIQIMMPVIIIILIIYKIILILGEIKGWISRSQ